MTTFSPQTVLDSTSPSRLLSFSLSCVAIVALSLDCCSRVVFVRCCLFSSSECSGSDTFGTDICTCRPYLVFALLGAVQCAQRGGVGIIIYFRKEGRSLGEVTKFRVYNARKRQAGGDTPENYFKQTESIAGIRDARFQVRRHTGEHS